METTGAGGHPFLNAAAADEWLTPGRFALFLGLLIFATFPGVLLGSTAFQALGQTNLDFRRIVVLPPEVRKSLTATQQTSARVLDAKFANQSIAIQTEAPAASLVVISQSHYPAWKAYVDGRPVTIWRANYAFQALEVPAGRHQIRMVYEDKMLLAGAVLSGLGLLACAGLCWRKSGAPAV